MKKQLFFMMSILIHGIMMYGATPNGSDEWEDQDGERKALLQEGAFSSYTSTSEEAIVLLRVITECDPNSQEPASMRPESREQTFFVDGAPTGSQCWRYRESFYVRARRRTKSDSGRYLYTRPVMEVLLAEKAVECVDRQPILLSSDSGSSLCASRPAAIENNNSEVLLAEKVVEYVDRQPILPISDPWRSLCASRPATVENNNPEVSLMEKAAEGADQQSILPKRKISTNCVCCCVCF